VAITQLADIYLQFEDYIFKTDKICPILHG